MFMSSRLVILVVVLILAFPLVSMKRAIDSAKQEREHWLNDQMPAQLAAMVYDAVSRNDIDTLDRALKFTVDSRAGVSAARWDHKDLHLEVLQRATSTGIPPAPRWFATYLGMGPAQQVHDLKRNGREYGTLTLEIERTIVADALWSQMLSILVTAAVALLIFGIAGSMIRNQAIRAIKALTSALGGSPQEAADKLGKYMGRGELAPVSQAIFEKVTAHSESLTLATQSEHLANSLIDSSLDAIVCIDDFGHIWEWNVRAEEVFGWSRKEVLGAELAAFIIPERMRESHKQGMNTMKISGVSRMAGRRVEMPALCKDGTEILIEMGIVQSSLGGRSVFLSHLRDITEAKQTQSRLLQDKDLLARVATTRREEVELVSERLKAALERERESNQLRMRFVETVSHEFRTPLTVISMAASLLEKKDIQLEQSIRARHFGSIRNSVDRLTEILDEILAMQKLTSSGLKRELQPTLMAYWLDEISSEVIPERKAHDKVSIQCDEVLHNPVEIDRHLLKYALSGILKNADGFSGKDTSIEIRARVSSNSLLIEVADRGVGVPPEDAERIFEPFYRGRNIMHLSGAGLGLAIVKGATDLLNGEVKFSSAPGVGSVFKLSVPLAGNMSPTQESSQ